jgi:hypothetical protein
MDAKAAARAELDAEREAGLWADGEEEGAPEDGDVEVINPGESR